MFDGQQAPVRARPSAGALRRRRVGALAALVLAALLLLPSAAALAASGGAGVGATPHRKAPARHVAAPRHRVARASGSNPFAGRGMWIWYVSASDGGNLSALIATAKAYHLNTVMIKAGDGSTPWSQFNSTLVSTLHAHGLRVCAWQYVYGTYPASEASVGAAAVHDGADCLLIDAESEYEGKYISAQTYIARLRAQIGSGFPVALAGFPYVDYHPSFPYSVFLGPGGAQYNVPQMYWVDIGVSVDSVYAHTFAYNRLYGRSVIPLGQVYNSPSTSDVIRFRQLSKAYGTPGVSWWDWQEAGGSQWRALAQPTRWLTGYNTAWTPPTLARGMKGDLVVWAQEHLVSAGYAVGVDGADGAQVTAAVKSFQQAKGLTVDGKIGPQTWQALLHYAPARVVWAAGGARTARGAEVHAARAGRTLVAPVPTSARLPARRNEIPGRLGAG